MVVFNCRSQNLHYIVNASYEPGPWDGETYRDGPFEAIRRNVKFGLESSRQFNSEAEAVAWCIKDKAVRSKSARSN